MAAESGRNDRFAKPDGTRGVIRAYAAAHPGQQFRAADVLAWLDDTGRPWNTKSANRLQTMMTGLSRLAQIGEAAPCGIPGVYVLADIGGAR